MPIHGIHEAQRRRGDHGLLQPGGRMPAGSVKVRPRVCRVPERGRRSAPAAGAYGRPRTGSSRRPRPALSRPATGYVAKLGFRCSPSVTTGEPVSSNRCSVSRTASRTARPAHRRRSLQQPPPPFRRAEPVAEGCCRSVRWEASSANHQVLSLPRCRAEEPRPSSGRTRPSRRCVSGHSEQHVAVAAPEPSLTLDAKKFPSQCGNSRPLGPDGPPGDRLNGEGNRPSHHPTRRPIPRRAGAVYLEGPARLRDESGKRERSDVMHAIYPRVEVRVRGSRPST